MGFYVEIASERVFIPVPEGKRGKWGVEKFKVSPSEARFFNARQVYNGRGREILPGIYRRLIYEGRWHPVMSTVPAEINDLMSVFLYAEGNVLINGLGLGIAVKICLDKPEVSRVTVIELDPDVIELVGSHYLKRDPERLKIIQGNAFEWKPPNGMRYDFVWHDIWDEICGDNWGEYKKLHRKYAKLAKIQVSWCRDNVYRLR